MTNPNNFTVSIIVRTYNEEQYIDQLLKTIRQQDEKSVEIILVDSESTDSTVQIASQYCNKIVHIKKSEFTFGYSLNKGIEEASAKSIILISAHTNPCSSDWISNLLEPLKNPKIAMVYGKQLGDHHSRFSEYTDLSRTFPDTPKILSAPNYFSHNANSSLKKELWENHPFDEQLSGQEDIEWAKYWMKRGLSVYYQPTASIIHSHHETSPQIYNRFRRESLAMKNLGLLNLSSIPSMVCREILRTFSDYNQLRNTSNQFRHAHKDILAYRYQKIAGTIHGLIQ